jgi:uncharacterized protein YcbX
VQVERSVRLERKDGISHFDEGPIHLLTSASLAQLETARGMPVDARRLRPNLVVETGQGIGFVEHEWIGRRVAVGSDVVLWIRSKMPRCVMVNLAQTDLAADRDLLTTATTATGAAVGVVADVLSCGGVAMGDQLRTVD